MSINYAHLWCTFACCYSFTPSLPPFQFLVLCFCFPPVQSSRFLIESLVARLEPCLSCADISMNDGCLRARTEEGGVGGGRERGVFLWGRSASPQIRSPSLSRGSHSLRALARLPSLDAGSLASTLLPYKDCGFRVGFLPPSPRILEK